MKLILIVLIIFSSTLSAEMYIAPAEMPQSETEVNWDDPNLKNCD